MTVRISIVAVLLVVASGSIAPSVTRAQVGLHVPVGRNCTPAIERITSDFTDFQQEARTQHLDLVTGDTTSAGGVGVHWGPDDWVKPTLSGAAKVQKYRDTMGRWVDRVQYYRKVVTELQTCTIANPAPPLTPDASGTVPVGGVGLTWENCVKTISTRFEPVARRYAEFLQQQPAQAAMSRVRSASSLVENYATKLGTPTSGAFGFASYCMDDYQQRAEQQAQQQAQQSANAGNAPAQPPPPASEAKNAAKSGGGPSTGMMVATGLVGAGLAVGVAAKAADEAEAATNSTKNCSSYQSTATNSISSFSSAQNNLAMCTTDSCWNSRIGAANTAWSNLFTALGNWCTCMGNSYQLTSSEKAEWQQLAKDARDYGIIVGTLPSCFR